MKGTMAVRLGELYHWLVEEGVAADPRSREEVEALLAARKKAVTGSKEKAVRLADDGQWDNPYGDTRILYGEADREVRRVLAGIDIDGAELLLADRWREQGKPVDLVIAHHPAGRALVQLHQVMKVQEDLLAAAGIPINVAEALMTERIEEVRRSLLPSNHQKVVDLARLLDVPFLCVHSPADNKVQRYLSQYLTAERIGPEKTRTVRDIVDALLDLPEFQLAAGHGVTPQVIAGKSDDRAGKIFIKMNGGTSGPEQSIEALVKAGVGTMVCMHLPEPQRKKAAEAKLRVVIAGHMACDSLGMNLLLDGLEQQGMEVLSCAGLLRYQREST
ncbi:NGG1p interacting factor NIF3 [Heliobacterium undosum]|uniref:NGG1p interacting factor NIF3 n=1 Tax=Heliomicrobium undosum TaxID=121734 RepID=A0A845L4N0_9FIRM|nr:NGG1p interacting factor NIF3 [Heliomicrobium undosum]MZP28718.1 NGG1p interacting factor NIF3 [Heliomicrobium undosum]